MTILQSEWKNKMEENKLREIRVFYDDGEERFVNMASTVTDKEILEYFEVGKLFNLGDGPRDYYAKVTKVEILDKKGGEKNELS